MITTLLAFWLLLTHHARAFEIEDFNDGLGAWTFYPQRIGTTTTPGWAQTTATGDAAAQTNPTATKSAYTWRLSSVVDLTAASSPTLEASLQLLDGYASLALEIGPANPQSGDVFFPLWETTSPSAAAVPVSIPLNEWTDGPHTIRVVLKKAYGVVINTPGARVHAIGVTVPPPPPPPPDPWVLSIGAFNAQVFGLSKMATEGVPAALVRIFERYDLVLLQEIRDASGSSLVDLEARLDATGEDWTVVVSERLGRTRSKEQYAYLYRASRLTIDDAYVFNDGPDDGADAFEREPFVAHVATLDGAYDFALIGLHADPDTAPIEMDFLPDVEADALEQWGDEDILILGDLNASCSYTTPRELQLLTLRTVPDYTWWIGDQTDTTTSNTVCAYDRLITRGDLSGRVVPGSADTYSFDQALALSADLTRRVSDHYPVELLLELPAE